MAARRRTTARRRAPWQTQVLRGIRRAAGLVVFGGAAVVLAFMLWAAARGRPQDLPWTPLDLGEPIGAFTGPKLAGLTEDFPKCEALMDRAGVRYETLPPRRDREECGYDDAVRLAPSGPRSLAFAPTNPGIACPVAAAMAMWEWNVVQPAARAHLGQPVAAIEHLGSYNCRRIAGSARDSWSEHSTADALDVAGFRLLDGTRVTIVGDWQGDSPKALFLREVRDGACKLFATTLSPDYNEAHRDHLHLDQAQRGIMGRRSCR